MYLIKMLSFADAIWPGWFVITVTCFRSWKAEFVRQGCLSRSWTPNRLLVAMNRQQLIPWRLTTVHQTGPFLRQRPNYTSCSLLVLHSLLLCKPCNCNRMMNECYFLGRVFATWTLFLYSDFNSCGTSVGKKKTKKNLKDVGGRERKIPIAKNYVHKKSRLCRESFSCHPCPFPLNVATSSIENASNSFPKRFFQTNKCLISFFVIKGPYRDGQGVGDISTSLDFVPTDWQCKNHLKHFPLSTWRVMIQLSFGQVSAH